jgi:O-antigen/teichoic acid export membrane protein
MRGVLAFASLLSVVLVARALGPAGRGEFFLFVAAIGVLTRLSDLGVSSSAIVFVGRYPTAARRIYGVLLRRLALLWIGAGLIVVSTMLLAGDALDVVVPRPYVWLLLASLPLTLYEQLWVHLMVGSRRVLTMNLVQTGGGLLALVLNVVFVVRGNGGITVAIGVFMAALLARVAAMLVLGPRGGAVLDSPPRLEQDTLLFGLRGYPGSVASLLWTRLPVFVLGALQGPSAVGIFSAAQQVQEQLLLPIQATQDAIYQRVTNRTRASATEAMDRYLRVALWGMLPLVLVCAALAPWIVPLVFGPAFQSSTLVLQVLLVGTALTGIPALLSPYFFGQLRRPGLMSLIAWSRVLMALALTVALAPRSSELGVAGALVVADVSATVMLLFVYVRVAPTTLRRAVIPRAEDFTVLVGRAQAALRGRA